MIVALRAPSLAKFGEVDTVPVSEKPSALSTSLSTYILKPRLLTCRAVKLPNHIKNELRNRQTDVKHGNFDGKLKTMDCSRLIGKK